MPEGPVTPVIERSSQSRILDTGAELLVAAAGDDGRIMVVEKAAQNLPATQEPRPSAGLIDFQVNGFAGVDFNDDALRPDDLDHALDAMLRAGVTTCLPTIITAAPDKLHSRLRALDQAVANSRLGPLMVPGYHLEGPFLNPAAGYAGCHPPQDMAPPSSDLVRDLERGLARPILYLTLAPELEGAGHLISWAVQNHKIVGVGHSALSKKDLAAAIAQGVRISTHLGNGVPQTLHRSDNPVLWQLAQDRMHASFIADGRHIPPETLKVFIRAKGIERSILVTDAVAAAGSPPGEYFLAGMAVELDKAGVVKAAGGSFLAGSSLSMDQAVANIVKWGIADFRAALRMACANPLALLAPAMQAYGIKHSLGEVHWSEDWRVLSVNLGPFMWQAP